MPKTKSAPTPPPPPPPPPGPPGVPIPPPVGGAPEPGFWGFINHHVAYLNQSKYFAGLCMIMLNVGSKFVAIEFSESATQYFKLNVTKQVLVFSMAWMATRDIYTALVITAVFVVLSEHLFNENSKFCVVPPKYRVLDKMIDLNGDGIISDDELKKAEETLRKAKQQKINQDQRKAFMSFDPESISQAEYK
jgi:hypothetical protein